MTRMMLRRWTGWAAGAVVSLALMACATTAPQPSAGRAPWIGAWASAQQIPEPHNALEPEALTDATLRQIVRLSIGGERIRVRVSNAFGDEPLVVAGAQVALAASPASSALVAGSARPLRFNGREGVVVPAGAEYVSDPVDLAAPAAADLAVTLEIVRAPKQQTSHPGSRATSYLQPGRHAGAPELSAARRVDHWYFLTGVDVQGGEGRGAVVVLGDSITDGFGVSANTNARWTDALAARLRADPSTAGLSVLNAGLGGGRVLLDGLGPNALARFERDVLARPGVRAAVVFIGVNDLGTLTRERAATPAEHKALVEGVTGAFAQMSARARERGVRLIGATILPFGKSAYYKPPPETEADRQAINAWIRTSGAFDGVIDFDAAFRDPAAPEKLRADVDNDGLHPSLAGYRAMADVVPLELFRLPQ